MAKRMFLLAAGLLLAITITSGAAGERRLNTDDNYSVKIAVTVNQNDNILGKLEYSSHAPLFPLQLVTFVRIGDTMHAEPYVYDLIERIVLEPGLHQIKAQVHNDTYGGGLLLGTIDFRDEAHPVVRLVTEQGRPYLGNLSTAGKALHRQLLPNVWLGH